MPEITRWDKVSHGESCWMPPEFPNQGRLPFTPKQIERNLKKIRQDEARYHDKVSEKLEFRMSMTCCHSLHISLFFDGTNNNEPYDTKKSSPPHPSNIAKLYHASAPENKKANSSGYYSYYIPGVGTPFPEIGTYDYYSEGLTYAKGGEDRINWALVQICNTLNIAIKKIKLDDNTMKKSVHAMRGSYEPAIIGHLFTGQGLDAARVSDNNNINRVREIESLLEPLKKDIITASPKLVSIKLFVYGFSRGAAEARTFSSWLNDILKSSTLSPQGTFLGLSVSIEFLGILDTVPAVGVANMAPIFTGHNGWAYGTQSLPKSNLIKQCAHLVSSHEQRQCFALDSIRYPDGTYPSNAVEVIYPGMHSDVGGGYPVNDQGKARESDGELLSQIALHDLYASAIDAGAPLAIHPSYIRDELKERYPYRVMQPSTIKEFVISDELITRFNAWRKTVTLETQSQPAQSEQGYLPLRFKYAPLEDAVEEQMGWMTAWRIARYASPRQESINLSHQPFFQASTLPDGAQIDPWDTRFPDRAEYYINEAKENHEAKLKRIQNEREKEKTRHNDNWTPPPQFIGEPLFDEQNSKGQLWEASLEFKTDYDNQPSIDYLNVTRKTMVFKAADRAVRKATYLVLGHDPEAEYARLKQLATLIYQDTVKLVLDNQNDHPRIKNVFTDIKKVIALYDDQIHDSRAWFMHTEAGISEMLGDYFLFRMIYFGNKWNKLTQVVSFDLELTPNLFELDLSKNTNEIQVFKHGEEYILKNNKNGQEYVIPNNAISPPTSDFLSVIGSLEIANEKKHQEKRLAYISSLPNVIRIT
ncbi:DUF2235 domain-containing protein [Providencia alcalifaciens]